MLSISPYTKARAEARERAEKVGARFYEVYVKCTVDECRQRDPKGLYAKFDRGEIKGLTGIDAPYEIPESPDLVLETGLLSVEECISHLVSRTFPSGYWHSGR